MPICALVGSRIRSTIFSPNSVGRVLTRKSMARFGQLHLDAPVLRHAALGDVHLGHHLEARREARRQVARRLDHLAQDAVGAEAHAVVLFVGLEVDVRGALLDGVDQHLVDEAHDRRVVDTTGILVTAGAVLVDGSDVDVIQFRRFEVVETATDVVLASDPVR
jgi:hypothetical protein